MSPAPADARRTGGTASAGAGNLLGRIGLLGSHSGVVEVRFKTRTRAFGVFPCDSVAISLQDPHGFLAALKAPE